MKKLKIICACFFFFPSIIFADISTNLSPTNNGNIYFSTGGIGKETKYYNKGGNSDIIGNYLSGSYYNTIYGFFDFINVQFVGSTNKCTYGYGYKLSGKAKSETAGYIDFHYNNNTFVYYCMYDKKLYGKAYMPSLGEQFFDGIAFEILPNIQPPEILPKDDTVFVNNTTLIFSHNLFQVGTKYGEETIFYIWKPKK